MNNPVSKNDGQSVVLLSGGPDSATTLAAAKDAGHKHVSALYLRAGHTTDNAELRCATKTAQAHQATLHVVDVKSVVAALGGQRIMMHSGASIMAFGGTIALSVATSYAARTGATMVLVGLHADDAAASPEYSEEFLSDYQQLIDRSGRNITLVAPFIHMPKVEVFRLGASLGVGYADTWSCIYEGELHCGTCGACQARARALYAVGRHDSAAYENPVRLIGPLASH